MKIRAILLTVSVLASSLVPGAADDLAQKGRAIFQRHHKAVVTVQIVVKSRISMAGGVAQTSEARQNVTGTVVDESGLTVLSLGALDPGQMVQRIRGKDERIKVESELGEVRFLLDEGREVLAEVVLRDQDLDLGFIRPRTPGTFKAVDLADSGSAQVLDPVISLNRLGIAAGRAYASSVERISAVVEQPRLFYVPDRSMTSTSLGSPCFTLDGKLVGVFVLRTVTGRGVGSSVFASQAENLTTIILPAADVLKAARQAPMRAPGADESRPAQPTQPGEATR